MRQINKEKKKQRLIAPKETHRCEIPQTARDSEVYIYHPELRRKGVGVWDFKGKESNS